MLKKPRFSLQEGQEIPEENEQTLALSSSPGFIRKQLENRQAPLPLEDTCRIEHFRVNPRPCKVPDSVILFKSGAAMEAKRWMSSEKDVIENFMESRMRRSSVR